MKYLPSPDLHDRGTHEAVRTGRLRLQPGQWVKLGTGKPSRFVTVKPGGSIWAVHPEGQRGVTIKRFKALHQAAFGKPQRVV